jgi:hypothetical protein
MRYSPPSGASGLISASPEPDRFEKRSDAYPATVPESVMTYAS